MSGREAIEAQIRALPLEEAEALQQWLSNYLEDRAGLTDQFVASIERGKADLAASRVTKQVHEPCAPSRS